MQLSIFTLFMATGFSAALALPTLSVDVSIPTAVPTTLPAIIDLPIVGGLKERAIDKRCSTWNILFNPCSCPSQSAKCNARR